MPVSVKCRSGKCEKFFQKLNPGDIEFFECDECSVDEVIVEKEDELEETPAQKRARIKAEREAQKKKSE